MFRQRSNPIPHSASPHSDPDDVHVRLRGFNETNDFAEIEAFGSADGVDYRPLGTLNLSPGRPGQVHRQYPEIPDPRHAQVMIHLNGVPYGPCHYFTDGGVNIGILDVEMRYLPSFPQVQIRISAINVDGDDADEVFYYPHPGYEE